MIPGILVVLPLRLRSPNGGNPGNRWAAIAQSREKKQHRQVAHMAVAAALSRRGLRGEAFVPALVTITRVSFGRLDSDNLAFSAKALRDGVADALGIDDGDVERVRFRYAQRKGPKGQHAVQVLVEQRDPAAHSIPPPTVVQPPAPSFAVPRFPAEKACECPSAPEAAALPLDERAQNDPERRAWWTANWWRVVWRLQLCPGCGAGWYVRELLEQEPAVRTSARGGES